MVLQYPSIQPLKFKRKRKDYPRSKIQVDLKNNEHTICGPACQEVPIPETILALNQEYQKLFPEKMPLGLPPARTTDHHITMKPKFPAPAQQLYRLNPLQDKELQKQLKELQEAGFIEPATSEYGQHP